MKGCTLCPIPYSLPKLVQSIIMTIWGHKHFSGILGIQYKALRFFLGVGKSCQIAGMFGEIRWVPFRAEIKANIFKFHCRLSELSGDRVTSLIYTWSKSLSDLGIPNGAGRTASLHLSQRPLRNSEIWERTVGEEMSAWSESVNIAPRGSESGGRLHYYRSIKFEPSPEPYLEAVCINRRRTITLLRCGCLPLEIESGKYRTPKTLLQRRTCQQGVGDQCHFLNFCAPLIEPRLKLSN